MERTAYLHHFYSKGKETSRDSLNLRSNQHRRARTAFCLTSVVFGETCSSSGRPEHRRNWCHSPTRRPFLLTCKEDREAMCLYNQLATFFSSLLCSITRGNCCQNSYGPALFLLMQTEVDKYAKRRKAANTEY